MWLLRTGLITVRDFDPQILSKFDFIHHSQSLTSLEPLKDGDVIEIVEKVKAPQTKVETKVLLKGKIQQAKNE